MNAQRLLALSGITAAITAAVIATAAPAPADQETWGAIAYSPLDGASGISSQQPKEADARSAAIIDCANNGGSGCQSVVTVKGADCASLVGNESLYSWGVASDPSGAKRSALDDLGEPGSELASTCGFTPGSAPGAATAASPTPTTAPRHADHIHPTPTVAPVPPAPTLR